MTTRTIIPDSESKTEQSSYEETNPILAYGRRMQEIEDKYIEKMDEEIKLLPIIREESEKLEKLLGRELTIAEEIQIVLDTKKKYLKN